MVYCCLEWEQKGEDGGGGGRRWSNLLGLSGNNYDERTRWQQPYSMIKIYCEVKPGVEVYIPGGWIDLLCDKEGGVEKKLHQQPQKNCGCWCKFFSASVDVKKKKRCQRLFIFHLVERESSPFHESWRLYWSRRTQLGSKAKKKEIVFPPGIEPGTLRVWGARDNRYTTETADDVKRSSLHRVFLFYCKVTNFRPVPVLLTWTFVTKKEREICGEKNAVPSSSDARWRTISAGQKSRTEPRMTWSLVNKHDHKMIEQCSSHRKYLKWSKVPPASPARLLPSWISYS